MRVRFLPRVPIHANSQKDWKQTITFQGVMSVEDGLVRSEEDGSANLSTLTILRKAGRYKMAAPVLKTGSAQHRGRGSTDAFLHRPVAQKQSARLISGRPRSVTALDDHFPRVAEAD